jgi:hypothetical protein
MVGKRLRHRTGRRALRETRHKCRSVHKDDNPAANDRGRYYYYYYYYYYGIQQNSANLNCTAPDRC